MSHEPTRCPFCGVMTDDIINHLGKEHPDKVREMWTPMDPPDEEDDR